jgi:hypothetical protein
MRSSQGCVVADFWLGVFVGVVAASSGIATLILHVAHYARGARHHATTRNVVNGRPWWGSPYE